MIIFHLFFIEKYRLSPLLLSWEYGILVSALRGCSRRRKQMGGKRKSPSRVDAERACRARPKSDAEVVQPPPERKLLCVGEPDRASLAVVCADERVPDDAVVVE